MQNIVVLTDFSYLSFNALELAKKIAEKIDGTIHLVHVIEAYSDLYVGIGKVNEDDIGSTYTDSLMEKVKIELESIKEAHASRFYDIKIKVLTGDPYQETKEFIGFLNPDLVVLGAKGQSDTEELFLGSFTDKVVRSISCPVITVKDNMGENQFKNIVYANDLKEEHEELIHLLKKFQALFESKIHIVKINTPKNFSNDIDTLVDLRRLADKYQLKKCTLNCYSHDDEEYGVVYFADDKRADLIAIGVQDRSGIRRLISGGSLAQEVSDHTFRPVLTYKFQKKE